MKIDLNLGAAFISNLQTLACLAPKLETMDLHTSAKTELAYARRLTKAKLYPV